MYLPAAPFYLEEVTDRGLAALARHCTRLRQGVVHWGTRGALD